MIRRQAQFTTQQSDALRRLSRSTGKSQAELIRQAIDQYLTSGETPTRQQRIERATRVAGMFASGRKDVSAYHDRHLADAFRE